MCSLDLLSAAGLVNYFGKSQEVDQVSIYPILLSKDSVKLALYGLGNIRDERLFRLFNDGKVTMMRPGTDEWFNLLVIHQNRVAHGPSNHIPERFIDSFFDLIFWGHEHECAIEPALNPDQQFYITQPGSSVATSLSEGESKTKHVGVLTIEEGREFHLEKIRLKTVRPFIMEDLVLRDQLEIDDPGDVKKVERFLQATVERLIQQANRQWLASNNTEEDDGDKTPPLPLIRLRVEYSGDAFNTYNRQRFGRMFTDRVANPNDILQLYRKRQPTQRHSKTTGKAIQPGIPEPLDTVQLESLVSEFLKQKDLDLLPETELNDAVKVFVEKDDKDAIKEYASIRYYISNCRN